MNARRIWYGAALALAAALSSPLLADPGAVYVMTNSAAVNEIVVFDRDEDGLLTFNETVATGGRGSGGTIDPLGSQGALILSPDRRWLYAVNAGSREISVFEVVASGLDLIDVVGSRGTFPISLTSRGDRVYVANAGGTPHIRGFKVRKDGTLKRFGRSRRVLESRFTPNGLASHPTQVEFSPDGEWLVVDDLDTGEIHVFGVDRKGRPSALATISDSAGGGPFGFTFSRGQYLVVTELFGANAPGTPDPAAVSSYAIADDGRLEPISPSVHNFQTATCWAVSDGGRFVYTTNTSSGTLTAYRVRKNGQLRRVPANGVSYRLGGGLPLPIDLAATADGRYLYTLNAGTGTVAMFATNAKTGALTYLGEIGGLPANAGLQGIAAR